jgi:hypothetical protein
LVSHEPPFVTSPILDDQHDIPGCCQTIEPAERQPLQMVDWSLAISTLAFQLRRTASALV